MSKESNVARRCIGLPGSILVLACCVVVGGCTTNAARRATGASASASTLTASEAGALMRAAAQAAADAQAAAETARAEAKAQAAAETARAEAEAKAAQRLAVNLLPLLEIVTDARLGTVAQTESGGTGGYTRFYVVGHLPAEAKAEAEAKAAGKPLPRDCVVRRCYSNESRTVWERILMGRELARVLSVKVDLRNPTIATTTTLASASYESTFSRGESWTTELNGQLLLTPYFRIGNNSVARIEASINATAKGKDQVSGKLLAILQSASELVAPTSALLTSLNAPRINQASQFVEQSLSGLFSNAVVEKSSNEFTPSNWSADQLLVTLHADFPMDKNQVTSPTTRRIGTWEIRAAAPIVSIFSRVTALPADRPHCDVECSVRQATLAFAGIAPSEVLNFPVGENLTLRQALITDTGVLNAIDDLKKGSGTAESGLARQLCSRLDERVQSLGFNRFDAAAIVWAFSQSAGLDAQKGTKLRDDQGSCQAAALARQVGLR